MIKKLVYWNDCRLARKRERAKNYEASLGMDKEKLSLFVRQILENSDSFFIPQRPCDNFAITKDMTLSFKSPVQTKNSINNTVYAKYIPPAHPSKKAVIIVPHLGGKETDYELLGKIISKFSIATLLVLMPYHGRRTPHGAISGELMVSANIKNTLSAFRQAVSDVYWATDWLYLQGYRRLGICGFSFGGIVASIATAHDKRLKAACLCLSGAEPDKVIFSGIATQRIKEALIQHGISQEELRFYWKPIDPLSYVERMSHTKVLMVNTPFDTNFPIETQKSLYDGLRKNKVESYIRLIPFPCGHYGAGKYLFAKLYLLHSILCFFKKEL
jgi:esterase/lipase